jgi:hypothetical protein
MLTLAQNVLILIGVMAASLLYMLVVNHVWPVKDH